MDQHLLSIILLTPLAGLAVLLFIPGKSKDLIRLWANLVGLAGFLISLPLVSRFQLNHPGYQFEERAVWIPTLGANYHIGIDGISLLLIMLTTLMGFIAILASWNGIQDRVKEYYAMFLILQTGMIGVFLSLDFFLFYVFWELVLVPMYFIIGVWGGPRKLYAAIKFFLYTLAGSVLMLLGILTLYFAHFSQFGFYTFEIAELMKLNLPLGTQQWVFWAFFIGFAIKVPMFPFHTWLPDAHVEAPTAGSVILAGVLLKMGTYGFLRFSLPLCPDALGSNARFLGLTSVGWVAALSIVGIIYGSMVAMVQKDMKKLVAYSSVAHLGFVMLGIFALNNAGIQGGILQSINHGLSTGGLFLLVGIVYERTHTRMIADYGGLSGVMPVYAMLFMVILLASIGLPLLNGFVGEFTILTGVFLADWRWAAWASLGVILGAAYMLWLYQRVFFGELTNEKNKGLEDVNLREILTLAPLIAMCFWIGLYPKPVFEMTAKSAEKIVAAVSAPNARRAAREAAPRLASTTPPAASPLAVPMVPAAAALPEVK